MNSPLDIEKLHIPELRPSSVVAIEQLRGGGNNRVFRIDYAEGPSRLLKQYFKNESDPRDRLKTDFDASKFLWKNGVRTVPEPLGCDPDMGCALYEFIDSQPFDLSTVSAFDLSQLAAFVRELRMLSRLPEAVEFGSASEASFSLNELFDSIERRLSILNESEDANSASSELRAFLSERLLPFYRAARDALGGSHALTKLDAVYRTLSPSDLGFHNGLKRRDGVWIFQDFEYFGWDDPAKLIVDVELHPAMSLSPSLCADWRKSALAVFADDLDLERRVERVFPLYGVKWCIILLNEFVPRYRARRGFAAVEPQALEDAQLRQLRKARTLLDRLQGAV